MREANPSDSLAKSLGVDGIRHFSMLGYIIIHEKTLPVERPTDIDQNHYQKNVSSMVQGTVQSPTVRQACLFDMHGASYEGNTLCYPHLCILPA